MRSAPTGAHAIRAKVYYAESWFDRKKHIVPRLTARPRSWRIGFETRFAWLPQASTWDCFLGQTQRFSILLCTFAA